MSLYISYIINKKDWFWLLHLFKLEKDGDLIWTQQHHLKRILISTHIGWWVHPWDVWCKDTDHNLKQIIWDKLIMILEWNQWIGAKCDISCYVVSRWRYPEGMVAMVWKKPKKNKIKKQKIQEIAVERKINNENNKTSTDDVQ